jgi:hypothetical protein
MNEQLAQKQYNRGHSDAKAGHSPALLAGPYIKGYSDGKSGFEPRFQATPELILPESDLELRNSLKVEKSTIEGMGLFADRGFKKYEVIWFEDIKNKGAKPENGGPLRWANHSDNPNAALVISQGGLFEVRECLGIQDIAQRVTAAAQTVRDFSHSEPNGVKRNE